MNELITTTEAAKIAGVGVSSIKRWADQSLIQIIRTPGGHRRVIKTSLFRFLQDAGASMRHDQKKRKESALATPTVLPSSSDELDHSSAFGVAWADEIIGRDAYEVQAALLGARARLGSWHAVADEACLGLHEIGLRWRRGEVSILDEHVASERVSQSLAMISESIPSSPDNPICLLSSAKDDAHTLGLSFLRVCLREAGWHPLWAGAAMPLDVLCKAVAPKEIRMVAVSASEASSDASRLSEFEKQLGACCQEYGTQMILGGSGAWPDPPSYGHRFYSFTELASFLKEMK